jgi:hypothetical protein
MVVTLKKNIDGNAVNILDFSQKTDFKYIFDTKNELNKDICLVIFSEI